MYLKELAIPTRDIISIPESPCFFKYSFWDNWMSLAPHPLLLGLFGISLLSPEGGVSMPVSFLLFAQRVSLIHGSLPSPATSTGRHSMKTQFLKPRGRSSWSSSSSPQKVGTLEGVEGGISTGECPPWLCSVFILPCSVGEGTVMCTGKAVCPSQRMQQRRKSKLCRLNVEGSNCVKQERFFFICSLFLESF